MNQGFKPEYEQNVHKSQDESLSKKDQVQFCIDKSKDLKSKKTMKEQIQIMVEIMQNDGIDDFYKLKTLN